MSLRITRGTADRLDQGRGASQEAFLIRIKDRHKRDLRDVQAFPQKVDPDKYIKNVQTHVADDLCTLQRIDVGMQILYADADILQIVRQILGHTLGKRSHQHLPLLFHLPVDLTDKVIDLSLNRANEHLGIQ